MSKDRVTLTNLWDDHVNQQTFDNQDMFGDYWDYLLWADGWTNNH